jgi:hypothetical protein
MAGVESVEKVVFEENRKRPRIMDSILRMSYKKRVSMRMMILGLILQTR